VYEGATQKEETVAARFFENAHQVPHIHFLPLPFESEGYHCAELERLLLGFAHKRASSDNLPPAEAKATGTPLAVLLARLAGG
jgi:hypothetical protein